MELQDIINEAKENDEAIDSTILKTLYPDPEELAEAYIKLGEEGIDIIEENQKYERMYEKNKCEDYLDKISDTDIFDKYEFLKRE